MKIIGTRSDFKYKAKVLDDIKLEKQQEKDFLYHLITYPSSFEQKALEKMIISSLKEFLLLLNCKNSSHILIIGLGSDNHTADSIGPKSLKNIIVNSHLKDLGLETNGPKISSLEPGVLGETGIDTKRIVESVKDEIKPDLLILIDSYVTEDIDHLNHSIIISNEGIVPGSGIKGLNSLISQESMGIPIISIGVATALEILLPSKKKDNSIRYLLTTNDIDTYVSKISKIIATAINYLQD